MDDLTVSYDKSHFTFTSAIIYNDEAVKPMKRLTLPSYRDHSSVTVFPYDPAFGRLVYDICPIRFGIQLGSLPRKLNPLLQILDLIHRLTILFPRMGFESDNRS